MMDGWEVLNDRVLLIEVEKMEDFQKLEKPLSKAFEGEVDVETIPKNNIL
jgi:hypothetical protein